MNKLFLHIGAGKTGSSALQIWLNNNSEKLQKENLLYPTFNQTIVNKMKINMLDCTLRDGGYINEWAFKDKHILKILNALSQSHTDIIECSFLEKGKDKI